MSVQPMPDPPPVSRAGLLAKQIGVVIVGFVIAAVMVGLGIWQLDVYNAQGQQRAQERASAPPVALQSVAKPGQEVGDAYGRQVRFSGSYDPHLQELVPTGSGNRHRVLTGLRLPGGGILPVVRGVVTGSTAPKPPTGELSGTGILMPSEGSDNSGQPGAQPTTVVLPSLAQQWNGSLVNGFVTLSAAESRAQSLQPAIVELPSSSGRLQNGFYAVQWWIFAGFAIWMAFRMARDFGRNPDGTMGGPPQDHGWTESAVSPAVPHSDSDSVPGDTTT